MLIPIPSRRFSEGDIVRLPRAMGQTADVPVLATGVSLRFRRKLHVEYAQARFEIDERDAFLVHPAPSRGSNALASQLWTARWKH